MNGDWTRYGGDPVRYKIAWKTVADVMSERAPNVALVWCVNHVPEKNIPAFYPGDPYVDWVGVNFYSVPFHDNNVIGPV
jgi:beta-mannanase